MDELQKIPHRPPARASGPVDGFGGATASDVIEIAGPGLKRDYAGLFEYWQMIRRHKGAVVLATILGGIVAFLFTLSSSRVYQAHTSLEIQALNDEFLNMRNVTPTASDGSFGFDVDIQTQVKILQSHKLLDRVRQKLDARPHPATLQPSDRLGLWRQALNLSPPQQDDLWREALGTAAGGVRVRSSANHRIVDVTCDSTSPQLASDFCNLLAQEFIDQNLEVRWQSTEYTGQWLTKQLQDLKIKLEQSQEELQAYARETSLLVTGDNRDSEETKLADLQKELSAAQTDRINKQSQYEMAVASPPGALPGVIDDATLKETQAALSELQSKLAQLQVTFTPKNAEVRRTQAQIAVLEASLEGARANVLKRIRNEYEAAQRREALLTGAYDEQMALVSDQTEEMAHYNLLKREVDSSRALYENLQQKLKEASIASALRASNIRVVDAADTPRSPYKPDVTRAASAGLAFGVMAGIAFAVMRERANRTLQDPGDAAYYLGLPELGVIPAGTYANPSGPAVVVRIGGSRRKAASGSTRAGAISERVEMVSWRQKSSLLAESYRTTLTSILFARRGGERPRLLVFTSASPKEGKTTTVCNLGIGLAEVNQSVLLIDGDMRKPRLHGVFDVPNSHGLSDLLLERGPLDAGAVEAACLHTAVPGLYVLPSGGSRRSASSLLHSGRLPELLTMLRGKFDTVLIDTPPMVNIADARMFAGYADGLILVLRSGVTTRDAALLAKNRFAEDGIPVLGTILNFWNPNTPGYGYYRNYYAGYQHYYGDGGDSDGGEGDGGGPVQSGVMGRPQSLGRLTPNSALRHSRAPQSES